METVWRHETKTLDELSDLKDTNHLIRRIAAFKWCSTHYIVFEWASGGTLRDFWNQNKNVHFNLEVRQIVEFLNQLCGLAKALSELHKTNTRTTTGIATNRADSFAAPGRRRRVAFAPQGDADLPEINHPGVDDEEASAKHWRHGDLKPENILVFPGSTWLGTLKIADLGLAKRHDFATEHRPEVTSTHHTTLHYEAPEVVANPAREPRSRRYDIWSMGCIMLESVIWLLYGSRGLDAFYNEKARLDSHKAHTLYFTTQTQPNNDGVPQTVATVSDIALHWINQMLENDPECQGDTTKDETTALGDLLRLVRDRLLIIAVPGRSGRLEPECRADATELLQELDSIRNQAETVDVYAFTGQPRRNLAAPRPLGSMRTIHELPKAARADNFLAVPQQRLPGSHRQEMVSAGSNFDVETNIY